MHLPSHVRRRLIRAGEGARRGGLLLEAILSIALFAVFLAAVGLALLVGQQSTVSAGDRVRGTFLAEQALEGARYLRDRDFESLSPGDYGIALSEEDAWQLLPSPVTTEDGYTVSLSILSHGDHWLEAVSSVQWDFGSARADTVSLAAYLTDWRREIPIGDWSAFHEIASLSSFETPHFRRILVSGDTAFVVGTQEEGGRGLYVFDVSSPSAPVRIASDFDLGASGFDLVLAGNRLFVATDDPSAEIRMYDITDPATLGEDDLLSSYDLPGDGAARAVAYYNFIVYAGTATNPDDDEFFTLFHEEDESLSPLDSLSIDGDVNDISLHDGYAYVATGLDSGELLVIDVFDAENVSFAPGTGMDLPDIYDGLSMATFGTSALLTRASGTATDEVILYAVGESPVPSPPPGPWTFESAGDVFGFSVDPAGRYGFLAGNAAAAQLRALDMVAFREGSYPLLSSYDIEEAAARDVFYDWQSDRLFVVSDSSFRVFAPGP